MDNELIKKSIRCEKLKARNELTASVKSEKDKKIFEQFIRSSEYVNAEEIYIYVSYKSEVDTLNIISLALKDGKKVCCPKVMDSSGLMDFHEIGDLSMLEKGYMGIYEPVDTCPVSYPGKKSVIVVPGSAFDLFGNRIGYGGGFYDRFLQKYETFVIGLFYELQKCDNIPATEFDYKIQKVITEEKIYEF